MLPIDHFSKKSNSKNAINRNKIKVMLYATD